MEKYPTLTFKSVAVEPVSPTQLRVTGDLTLKGVTQRITVPVELLGTMPFRGGEKAGFVIAAVDHARIAEARKMVPSLTHDRKYAAPVLHKPAVAKAAE